MRPAWPAHTQHGSSTRHLGCLATHLGSKRAAWLSYPSFMNLVSPLTVNSVVRQAWANMLGTAATVRARGRCVAM